MNFDVLSAFIDIVFVNTLFNKADRDVQSHTLLLKDFVLFINIILLMIQMKSGNNNSSWMI